MNLRHNLLSLNYFIYIARRQKKKKKNANRVKKKYQHILYVIWKIFPDHHDYVNYFLIM